MSFSFAILIESESFAFVIDNSSNLFLHAESDRLDKTAIGEYLGELENKETMYSYVDEMNYTDMNFVKALRYFLDKYFRYLLEKSMSEETLILVLVELMLT